MKGFLLLVSFMAFGETDIQQGAYLVRTAGCYWCHTQESSRPYAGGYRLPTPFGSFYTPNITPDMKTGIGSWSEDQFLKALRDGVSPKGEIYYPVFPYRSFTKIFDDDIRKMYRYLRTLTPIEEQNRSHELNFPYSKRALMYFWQMFYFGDKKSEPVENIKDGTGPFIPDANHDANWNRGAYLAEALIHCSECHTPRNELGHPKTDFWMAGTVDPISGNTIPNITPDMASGLGRWTKEDWKRFLSSGITPDLKTIGGDMANVIRDTSSLTESDRDALVEYLMNLEPITNDPH